MKFKPKKRLGQHFLKSQAIVQKMVDALLLDSESVIIEIGPGLGALTEILLQRPFEQLIVIEKDEDCIEHLKARFGGDQRLLIIHDDASHYDFGELKKTHHLCVVGNLPYYAATEIIINCLFQTQSISQMLFMVQREVAERMASSHGKRSFGSLSVLCQSEWKPQILFHVPPMVFSPPPKVESTVILFQRIASKIPQGYSIKMLEQLIHKMFLHKRKTLANALKSVSKEKNYNELLLAMNIPLKIRAEALPVETLLQLAVELKKQNQEK